MSVTFPDSKVIFKLSYTYISLPEPDVRNDLGRPILRTTSSLPIPDEISAGTVWTPMLSAACATDCSPFRLPMQEYTNWSALLLVFTIWLVNTLRELCIQKGWSRL